MNTKARASFSPGTKILLGAVMVLPLVVCVAVVAFSMDGVFRSWLLVTGREMADIFYPDTVLAALLAAFGLTMAGAGIEERHGLGEHNRRS